MAELVPAPFADLVSRLYREPQRQDALFELKRNRWYAPQPGGPDLSVTLHGRPAGNPLGPAAGPHTQMAQNILLSYVAGGRILELKTVQINDRLTIGRPCIDMVNVGYNIEWSQELLVEESIREYVAGAMLVRMFRFAHEAAPAGVRGPSGEAIYDLSVGYDLAGIRSDKIRAFLHAMRDASKEIERLRAEIPSNYAAARAIDYPTQLSDSITLSTFHGCPADEIERICEFLIGEEDFDVIVKMNPPMLGKERLEHLLHDVLGYTELTVNLSAYKSGLSFEEGVQLCKRLTSFAVARGRSFGAKFSNTLEVTNHRDFFAPDNKVMYLSGQPLHVITMTLTDEFVRAMGPEFPISFSAGIDAINFPAAVACGFTPITVSSDLLRPGGYGRMSGYLEKLASDMRRVGAGSIEEYILRARRAAPSQLTIDNCQLSKDSRAAAARNLSIIAEETRNDPRYRAEKNRKIPTRVDSHLETFDCLTCDKCLPVCPNAANFTYPTPLVAFDYHDWIVTADGSWRPGEAHRFEISETMQIACYSDFCNECGNCDTFCPEYGGPYIKKPTFFGSVATWEKAAPRDGFVTSANGSGGWIRGRVKGRVYELKVDRASGRMVFDDGVVEMEVVVGEMTPRAIRFKNGAASEHGVNMWAYHTLRHLFDGVHDRGRINQVNAGDLLSETAT